MLHNPSCYLKYCDFRTLIYMPSKVCKTSPELGPWYSITLHSVLLGMHCNVKLEFVNDHLLCYLIQDPLYVIELLTHAYKLSIYIVHPPYTANTNQKCMHDQLSTEDHLFYLHIDLNHCTVYI